MPQLPGGEVGQFQVAVGVDQPRHDDTAGEFGHLPRADSGEKIESPDGDNLAIFHGNGPSGNRRPFYRQKI
jgi:hypothetical protein